MLILTYNSFADSTFKLIEIRFTLCLDAFDTGLNSLCLAMSVIIATNIYKTEIESITEVFWASSNSPNTRTDFDIVIS